MELLQNLNNGYSNNHVNMITTTTYLPAAFHTTALHHSSKRNHHHRHLTDIDWSYEIEKERDNRDRILYNEKVLEVKSKALRRSRPRTVHHKMLDFISYCVLRMNLYFCDCLKI